MGTIADKLNRVLESKSQIKDALISKGVEIPDDTPFRSYPSLVDNIQTGGADLNLAFGENPPEDTTKLWVKGEEESKTIVIPDINVMANQILETVLPEKMYSISTATVNTNIYLFGGNGETVETMYQDVVRVYDTVSDTLRTLSVKLPIGSCSHGVGVYKTTIYLFGGCYVQPGHYFQERLDTIWAFDTITETLRVVSSKLPVETGDITTSVIGDKIYLFGGTWYNGGTKYLDSINVFDVQNETITELNDVIPVAMADIPTVSVDQTVYMFIKNDASDNYISSICAFNATDEKINKLNLVLPELLIIKTNILVGDHVYLFGRTASTEPVNTIVKINISNFTFMTYDAVLPNTLTSSSGANMNGKIYLFGGLNNPHVNDIGLIVNDKLDSIAIFNPKGIKNEDQLLIVSKTDGHEVTLLNTGDITLQTAVNSVYKGNSDGTCTKVPAHVYENGEWVEI